jgi:hypothetical protein
MNFPCDFLVRIPFGTADDFHGKVRLGISMMHTIFFAKSFEILALVVQYW